jgi:hypothetical protein
MAHDIHHDTDQPASEIRKSTISYRSAFWFTIILAGLFIAAVNFVNIMGKSGEEEGHNNNVEHATEATSSETLEGETGTGKPVEHSTETMGVGTTPTTDSAKAQSY